jgi:hypothetical protein
LTTAENQDFVNAKSALLKYYSDIQISLGARLIGFGVAIFTLLQVVNWNKTGLSEVFSASFSSGIVTFALKLVPFFVAVLILMTYSVRTIFRYASVSGVCNSIIGINISNIDQNDPVHYAICKRSYEDMLTAKIRVFKWLPFEWFLTGATMGGKEKDKERNARANALGWFVSIFIAFFASVILLWLMW